MNSRPLVVLMSTPPLTPRTNPYATLLTQSLAATPGVRPEFFSWRRALFGPYHVLHLHWPESHLRGSTRLKTAGRRVLFVLILVRACSLRRPIVRTVHNLKLPRDISGAELMVLRITERWTKLRIRMNDETPTPAGRPFETIKHGHYREWFAEYAAPKRIPGRLVFFGLVRKYKGLPELMRAFASTAAVMDGLSLHIGGHPSTEELAASLRSGAATDSRLTLCLRRLSDEELVADVGSAELVVLPYAEMHNSGAVLTSLSLGRPVLVPDNEVNRRLDDEVGTGWVYRYVPPLTGSTLVETLDAVRRAQPRAAPRMDSRDWARIGEEHRAAYERAVSLAARPARRFRP